MRSSATLLHVDLDAFYASAEVLDDPTLAGRVVVVGGLGRRGVVATANYEARTYGIHSAMPTMRARRLGPPDAVFLSPRMDRYQELSAQVMAVFADFTPLVEPLSLDEAFLDVAGAQGDVLDLVERMRARVRDEVGLVASVGVATTKFLAKVASDLAKPDGVLVVPPGTEKDFLAPLPIERLWGVGPATATRLRRLGISTIGQLADADPNVIAAQLGQGKARHLVDLSHNRDERAVVPEHDVKSVGHEETFSHDVMSRADLEHRAARFADRVGARLRSSHLTGRTVQLKVRYSDFTTITRSHTRGDPTDLAHDIAEEARALLADVDLRDGVRLLGVSVSGLGREPVQDELPFAGSSRQRDLERMVDSVKERFGEDALERGRVHES